MPTLDYAARPAKKPPRDRPVSAVSAGLLLGLMTFLLIPVVPLSTVGGDRFVLILAVGLVGGTLARWTARRIRTSSFRGWWAMVGLPLLCGLVPLIVVLSLYNLLVPLRAFHNVFNQFPPPGATLDYSPRRNFGAGGHCFYFRSDPTTVDALVTAAGLAADDEPARKIEQGGTPANAAINFLLRGGWFVFFAPEPPAVDARFYSRKGPCGRMRMVHDAATGEVWAVKEGW